jgi:hypothetical protein
MKTGESRFLRKALGPRRVEVTGDLRKVQNEQFHNLYFSPNIIMVIKSRRKVLCLQGSEMFINMNVYK